jgi:ABC-2 type transport system permease protein
MTRLLGAEMFKLRTTRTFYALVGVTLGLSYLITLLIAALAKPGPTDSLMRIVMTIAGLAGAIALVLGVLSITTEFRHGTITPTLLVAPRRVPLLVAKLIAALVIGLVLGLLATGFVAIVVPLITNARGIDDGVTGSATLRMVIGGTLACGLNAALGFGLGAVVRNQVGAMIGALVYLFVAEPLLTIIPTVGDWISEYGLNGTLSSLRYTQDPGAQHALGQVPGGLLLLGYVAVLVIVGIILVDRRDVTA